MKLDGCSFQAPHASPRLRLMETIFCYLFLILLSFIKICHYVINLCSSESSHIMATKASMKKKHLFPYYYLLDEHCSAFIYV